MRGTFLYNRKMGKWIHVIEDVDNITNRMKCRECGWVPSSYKQGRARCSVARRATKHAEGYRMTSSDGYIRVWRGERWIMEHREVMENILDRPLREIENVHHKNGVRDDNRPENLELWVVAQPQGQRPEDLVQWAKKILELYA